MQIKAPYTRCAFSKKAEKAFSFDRKVVYLIIYQLINIMNSLLQIKPSLFENIPSN
jgi:hypothetical protein